MKIKEYIHLLKQHMVLKKKMHESLKGNPDQESFGRLKKKLENNSEKLREFDRMTPRDTRNKYTL